MNDEKVLTQILHTVQMGQSGIRCVMEDAVDPELKKEMKKQLLVYDAMEKQALSLGEKHGWKLKNIASSILSMSEMMAKMQLMGGQRDSKIAGMLIQGNTRGMIQGSKNLHHNPHLDAEVRNLGQQLVAQEKISIDNSQRYL